MIATTISNIKENKREYGLDLFRILCCIFVINFHIWDLMILNSKSASVINFLLYQIGSFCVAGFFVMNGYFAGRKEDVCLKRIIKRIVRYFVLAFLITVIFCFLYIIFGLQVKNPFLEYLEGFVQKGIIPTIWYLISYAILMLISPVFIKVKRENKNVFYGMTGCAILLNIFFSKILYLYIKNTSSILWFHYYIAFFLIGMLASDFDIRKKWKKKVGFIAFCGMVLYLYFNMKTNNLPQAHYGSWYFYIYLMGVFFLFKSIEIQKKLKEIINKISSKTFLIYLIGFPFSFLIDHFVHFNMKQNVLMISIIIFVILLLALTLTEKLKTKILEIIHKIHRKIVENLENGKIKTDLT